jgi:predicted nucleic acid-binding protein
MAELPVFVLDPFALLAYLQDEIGAARVQTLLEDAAKEKSRLCISTINLGELLYIIERREGVAKTQDVLGLIRQLPLEILPADEEAVFAAAHIKASHALSYADTFAVACAIQEKGTVLTSDPEFESVVSLIPVEWLKE